MKVSIIIIYDKVLIFLTILKHFFNKCQRNSCYFPNQFRSLECLLTSILLYMAKIKLNFLIGWEVFVTVHTEFKHPVYCFNQILIHLDCSKFSCDLYYDWYRGSALLMSVRRDGVSGGYPGERRRKQAGNVTSGREKLPMSMTGLHHCDLVSI